MNDSTMANFEHPLPGEDADIAGIVRGLLTIQARYAATQHRLPERGTHAKGVCARAELEIFDLSTTLAEPALAARLARGLFAAPGIYPATVRFANARSFVTSDRKQDVRALSFSVDVPAGIVAPEATRLDYSMNNGTTFPLNDARAFAVFMQIASAHGVWNTLKALWSLPFRDLRGLVGTAIRGRRAQRNPVRPYQSMRYWSTVPFAHGTDEAIKYSATPVPGNPAGPLARTPEALQDELVRHLNEDAHMSAFDVRLQLLDVDRMTMKGKTHDASFWIENASVEWNEKEAPFHTVGRLTLLPKSHLAADSCAASYIDVTEHATPESRPLGSINRARHAGELASRNARLAALATAPQGAAVPAAASSGLFRVMRKAIRVAVVTVASVAAIVGFLSLLAIYYPYSQIPPLERVDQVLYPDQGWGAGLSADARQTYYYTAQGAGLRDMRYTWFTNLEMPWGQARFANPDHLRRYGFLVDPPTPRNPDQLPVGFTKHFDAQLNEELVDITCAACHTGQLNVTKNGKTTAVRIDGGQAMHAFTTSSAGHFLPMMMASMASTALNPFKFNRFADRVLGAGRGGRWELHRQFRQVIYNFVRLAWTEKSRHLVPTEEGFGRTDALARIANTVFGDNLDPVNYAVGNAPVSFPPVWNIWKFDWVQYNASVSQPMARNIGEAMGVGAKYALVDRYGRPLAPDRRFRSSALIENLHTIELTLRTLQPPAWPEAFGPIDMAKAERGKALFEEHCVSCHGPHIAPAAIKARNAPLKTASDPEWIMKTLCVDDIGTDPNAAVNFANATVDITKLGMTADDLRRVARPNMEAFNARESTYLTGEIARLQAEMAAGTAPENSAQKVAALERQLAGLDAGVERQLAQIDPRKISVGAALGYVGMMIRENAYRDLGYTPEQQAERDGFGIVDLPQVIAAYKPRPLAGAWATPPYLHNGSVPTIYDLLSPASERPKTFLVGSREFDTVRVGLAPATGRGFLFDTSKSGNHNTGHEFNTGYVEWTPGSGPQHGLIGPLLTPDERLAIIEHLKVRNDDRDGPQTPHMPESASCQVPSASNATAPY
jgi:cytochrome c5